MKDKWLEQILRSSISLHILIWLLVILYDAVNSIKITEFSIFVYVVNLTVGNLLIILSSYSQLFWLKKVLREKIRFTYLLGIVLTLVGFTIILFYFEFFLFRTHIHTKNLLNDSIYRLISIVFALILNSAILLFVYFSQEWVNTRLLESSRSLERAEYEVKFLKSQLNPHFLFNTLNNIYGLVINQSPMAKEFILKLSDIMKYVLYESNVEKVLLKKDVEHLKNYIELEKLRQGNNAVIQINIRGTINDQLIVPLLLLPLIENAFKHGVNNRVSGAYMELNLNVADNILDCKVENSMPLSTVDSNRKGIGLENLGKRLELFYKNKYSYITSQNKNRYIAHLKIELS